jgi:hypothetical protein
MNDDYKHAAQVGFLASRLLQVHSDFIGIEEPALEMIGNDSAAFFTGARIASITERYPTAPCNKIYPVPPIWYGSKWWI